VQLATRSPALPGWKRLIKLRPDFGLAHLNAGRILGAKGDKTAARQHLQQALRSPDPSISRQAAAELQKFR